MPPYFFRTSADEAAKIVAKSPEGAAKVYEVFETQDWVRGAMGDHDTMRAADIDRTHLDFLANEAVGAMLSGGALMRVDADSREALQGLAVAAQVNIQPLN